MVRLQLQSKHLMNALLIPTPLFTVLCLLYGCHMFVQPTDAGERMIARGEYGAAILSLSALEGRKPTPEHLPRLMARAHRSRAAQHLRTQSCERAFEDFEAAAKREPRLALNYQLTEACFRRSQTPIPVALARVLFELGDLRTQILKPLLTQAVEQKHYAQAQSLARTLAARNHWTEDTAKWLAREATKRKELRIARFWLLKLINRVRDDAYLLTRAAITCAQLRDDQLAHQFFSRAYRLSPSNRVILSPWRESCRRRNDSKCLSQIELLLQEKPQDRGLRPLPKSRR